MSCAKDPHMGMEQEQCRSKIHVDQRGRGGGQIQKFISCSVLLFFICVRKPIWFSEGFCQYFKMSLLCAVLLSALTVSFDPDLIGAEDCSAYAFSVT